MSTFEVCKNPWCKGTFVYKESDMVPVEQNIKKSNFVNNSEEVEKVAPSICPKCKSLETEMSGGVEWKDKEYECEGTPTSRPATYCSNMKCVTKSHKCPPIAEDDYIGY